MRNTLNRMLSRITEWSGSFSAICFATFSLVTFLAGGIIYGFTENYQLVANTFMSAVSYFMLFVIQRTQNHDTKAMHLKLDEILLKMKDTNNRMIGIESLNEEDLSRIAEYYAAVVKRISPSDTCR
jgi:low affinity Fe/Cu permease